MDMENLILQEFRIRIIAIIINPKNGIILRSKRINLRWRKKLNINMIMKVQERKLKIQEDWFKTILLLVDPVRNNPPITKENLLTKMEIQMKRNYSISIETKIDSLILLTMTSHKMESTLSIIENTRLRDWWVMETPISVLFIGCLMWLKIWEIKTLTWFTESLWITGKQKRLLNLIIKIIFFWIKGKVDGEE